MSIFYGWTVELYIALVVIFFFGAALGSFLNVVLYRTEKKEDWIKGRSRCEKCGRQIAWYENIPMISWLVLRGKCRTCEQKISWVHPVMELLMGLWFGGIYVTSVNFWGLYQAPWNWLDPLFWLGIGILLILVIIIDGTKKIIPDWLNVMLLAWTGIYLGIETWGGILTVNELLIRVGVGLGTGLVFLGLHYLVLKIYKRDGFGLGDVKLLTVLGLLLGWPNVLVMAFLSFMLGAVGGLVMMWVKKKGRKTEIPFGPFISVAAIMTAVWGQLLWSLLFF